MTSDLIPWLFEPIAEDKLLYLDELQVMNSHTPVTSSTSWMNSFNEQQASDTLLHPGE
jgi:hypothetical protein